MAFVNDTINYGDHKTIDRERNIILRLIPGCPDPDQPYSLEWHDQIIKFRCEKEILKRYRNETNWKFDIRAKVSSVEIPEDFPEMKRCVLDVIKESLIAYGASQSERRTGHIEVEFSSDALKGV